ncbi:MAG: hypothetical protein ACXWDO_00275 [Bacteroidia bacterium]
MQLPQITLHLNFLQWSWLANKVRETAECAPVKGYELQSLVIQDMYHRRLHAFTFYVDKSKMGMRITLNQYEGQAINQYFTAAFKEYGVFMQMFIEPKLLAGKPLNCTLSP